MIAIKTLGLRGFVVAMATVLAVASSAAAQSKTSASFAGPKANKGTVTYSVQQGKQMLTLSPDFVVPDTPDPHWQVVDAKGTPYLLQRLMIKGDKLNRTIELPAYIKDVSKVVIWCAWAEVNLGEASFAAPTRTSN